MFAVIHVPPARHGRLEEIYISRRSFHLFNVQFMKHGTRKRKRNRKVICGPKCRKERRGTLRREGWRGLAEVGGEEETRLKNIYPARRTIPLEQRSIIRIYYHPRGQVLGIERERGESIFLWQLTLTSTSTCIYYHRVVPTKEEDPENLRDVVNGK